jgi:hypothetical protein
MVQFYRRRARWAVLLAISALAAACAKPSSSQQVSPANAAAATGAVRQGHFAGRPADLSVCVAMGAHQRHPELNFDLVAGQPEKVSAKKYQSDETAIWTVEFYAAGTAETDAFLRNVSATPSDLDEAWHIVATCAG